MEKLINELKDWLDENFVTLGERSPNMLDERLYLFADDVRRLLPYSLALDEHNHRVSGQEPCRHDHTHYFEEPESISHLFNFP